MAGNPVKLTIIIITYAAGLMSCQLGYNYRDMPAQELKKTIISGKEIEELVDKQSRFEVGPRDDKLYIWKTISTRHIRFFIHGGDIYLLDYTFDRIKVFDFKKKAKLLNVIKLPKVYQYMYPYKKDKIILLSRFKHCAIVDFEGSILAHFEYKFPNYWDKYYFRKNVFYRYERDNEVHADKITLTNGGVKIKEVWSEKHPDPEERFEVWQTENYHRYVKALEKKTGFLFKTKRYLYCFNYTGEGSKNLRKYIIVINTNKNKFLRFYIPWNINKRYFTANPYPSMNIYATDQYYYFWTFKARSGGEYIYYLNRLPIAKLFEKFKDKLQKI